MGDCPDAVCRRGAAGASYVYSVPHIYMARLAYHLGNPGGKRDRTTSIPIASPARRRGAQPRLVRACCACAPDVGIYVPLCPKVFTHMLRKKHKYKKTKKLPPCAPAFRSTGHPCPRSTRGRGRDPSRCS